MSSIDDETGRTKAARTRHSGGANPSTYTKIPTGVSCLYCGEDMSKLHPGETGTAYSGCPRCSNVSGGGVNKKTVDETRRSLDRTRLSHRDRMSLKERE
jgi:hypothetical protein